MWPFSARKKRRRASWRLSDPVLRLSRDEIWSLRHAVEGLLILGTTGSGKTSGSARAFAKAMLLMLFGGLVLTAKADERGLWEALCKATGRLDDLIVVRPDRPWRFNFLDYELKRGGDGAGHTENIVNMLMTVLEVAERNQQSGGGREDEGFWKRAMRQLVRNLVDLLVISTGSVSVPDLHRLLIAAPTSHDEMRSPAWRERSFCFHCLKAGDEKPKAPRQEHDFGLCADYFLVEYPNLSDKTRSVVVATFTSLIDVLNRGALRELFCTETNLTPDVVADGKIILLDLPAKEWGEVGLIAQVLFKYAFQRAIERRAVSDDTRPVFLWADEAQNFVTSYDMQYQTTCRSAKAATVYITQNVSNFYAALGGGDKGKVEADSLFSNLNTKVFHANSDPITNDWAASLIGRSRQCMINTNHSEADSDWIAGLMGLSQSGQTSAGMNEIYEYEFQPSGFSRFRTGGPQNRWKVDGLVFQNGRVFRETGRTWLPVTFDQKG